MPSKSSVMGTYARFDIELSHGRGSEVFDVHGKRFIDFLSGISVLCLGHAHPRLVEALKEQSEKLWHVSNLYSTEQQELLAHKLCENSFADKAFFCNSGAEAIEGALKLARIAAQQIHSSPRPIFISMEKSFHGRTFGALSATGQSAYQEPFQPLVPDFRFVPFNDIQALKEQLDDQVAAVILEPLQAEGGLIRPESNYLKQVRELCDQNGSLLIFDEVQVGIGRLGERFAYQKYGVTPDIMTLAKGLGGGFPIGALLAQDTVAQHFKPGTHASTFGGNPLACRIANEVLNIVFEDDFLSDVRKKSEHIQTELHQLKELSPSITEHRGEGLLQGLSFDKPIRPLIDLLHQKGLLTGPAGAQVLRLAPALNISEANLSEGLQILKDGIGEFIS